METPDPAAAPSSDVARFDLEARLWARAHHEAAHAVVATVLGAEVGSLEIWSGPQVGGRVEVAGLDGPTAGPADQALARRIAYLLAGPLAEHIAASGPGAVLNEAAALAATVLMAGVRDPSTIDPENDVGRVARLFVDRFGPDGEAAAAAAADHLALAVEGAVREQWLPIQAVALLALRDGRLTEEQLRTVRSAGLAASDETRALLALADPASGQLGESG